MHANHRSAATTTTPADREPMPPRPARSSPAGREAAPAERRPDEAMEEAGYGHGV